MPVQEPVVPTTLPTSYKAPAAFRPFTGKIKGKKVRMRVHADLESQIIRELDRNELVSVIAEKGEFYAVEPPSGVKAYVFRSFILDNVVEGNRVNVRLEPNLEAPIIGHLNAGDKIDGTISPLNNKWYEIAPPSNVQFFIAKEFVDNIGGLEVKNQMDKRRQTVEQLIEAAALLSKAELRKPFEEIDINRITRNYNTVIKDYVEFNEHVQKAKEALANVQETYLQKRLSYLEERATLAQDSSEHDDDREQASEPVLANTDSITDKMKLWDPIEEALFLSWAQFNDEKTMEEYYEEQTLCSMAITGILEAYTAPVKNKPGDFLLKDRDLPVAYVYSSQVNLQNLVGKKVTVLAVPRPNNNFAFPAYYVLSIE
ncbi:MAG: SH3 domain-containing protein [Chlamydiota bacterium]